MKNSALIFRGTPIWGQGGKLRYAGQYWFSRVKKSLKSVSMSRE
ncbi:hypothetical protein [Deinococcus radiopugnans]|nr:hypothetical protein [Deinococcus radiopugnans]